MLRTGCTSSYDYRHHRLLHNSDGCGLGDTSRGASNFGKNVNYAAGKSAGIAGAVGGAAGGICNQKLQWISFVLRLGLSYNIL